MSTLTTFWLLLAVTAAAPAVAQQPFVTPNAVDPLLLDDIRGGFAYGDDLLVTLGIDRLIKINGNVVEQSTLQLGDVGKLASGEARLAGDSLQGTRLIQNGQAQLASGIASGALGGTVIQNTLNDQMISNQTTIRASVNNAGVVQAMNFNATLNQALNSAVSSK
jgi:hypothetical protein